MLRGVLLLALIAAGGANAFPGLSPRLNVYAAEVVASVADSRKLDAFAASRTRYLSLPPYLTAEQRDLWRRMTDLWANSLSREPDLYKARRVSSTLLAVNVDDYGWDPDTWEQLANEDPFYHVQIDLVIGRPGRMYFAATKESKAGWYDVNVTENRRVPALAPWLPVAEAAELVARCQSAAPIVRADWWFSRAAIQFGRKGTGYYDWLRVKDRDQFDRLVAFDRRKSQDIRREVAAIVARSGVSNFPRQIFRFQSLTGGYWQTRDVLDDNKDARNALRQLDGDYRHQAEEIYGFLPNGLFAYFLSNDQGVRQDSAPDGIGPDKTAPGNDGKIHIGLSCVRCHVEGLRPIQDWGRRIYSGPLRLTSPDPVQFRRLVQLYLGELQEYVDGDTAAYAKRLVRLTGWKTDEAAKAIGVAWAWYEERDILPADAAAELGVSEAAYVAKLRAYFQANPLSDSVLASHLADPPIGLRSGDDWEQVQPLVGQIVFGAGGGQ